MSDAPHSDAQSGGLSGPGSGILATFKRALSSVDAARRRFLAATRLSLDAVCRESVGLGGYDYHTHDYVRHGTTSLFAALNVATGQIIGKCTRGTAPGSFSSSSTTSMRP